MISRIKHAARVVVYWAYRNTPKRLRARTVRLLTPNYTLGAVVLLRDGDDRLLLVRKPNEPEFSLPGGLLEKQEQSRVGAARELAEEVGISIAATDLVPANPNALINARSQQVDCVFTARVDPETTPARVDNVELAECGWYGGSDLPALTWATARLLACYGIGPLTNRNYKGEVDV